MTTELFFKLPAVLQAATFAPTCYVIELYWTSLIPNAKSMYYLGTLNKFHYPYGIILPCLKLSLIAKLNLN